MMVPNDGQAPGLGTSLNGSGGANGHNGGHNSSNGSSGSRDDKKKPGTPIGTIATPTRVSIKEANDHLQLLHKRVMELETIISHQANSQREKEELHKTQYRELKSAKESQIEELTKIVVRLENRVKDLESEIREKNVKLEESQRRLSLLDVFILNSVPTINNLLYGLKELSATKDDEDVEQSSSSTSAIKDQIQPNGGRVSSGIGILSDSTNGPSSDTTSSAPSSTPTGTSANSACDDSGFFLVSDIKTVCGQTLEKESTNSSTKDDSAATDLDRDYCPLPIKKSDDLNSEMMTSQPVNKEQGTNPPANKHYARRKPGRKVMLVHNSCNAMQYDDSYDFLAENGYLPGARIHSKVGRSFSIISNFSEDEESQNTVPTTNKLSAGIVDL